ncbi:MAG: hypothetical protein V1743_02380 [Nanoarchaeota archaeon]
MKEDTKNYELIFGSNTIKQCYGAIEFVNKGQKQQILRFREGEGKVLCTCAVRDIQGKTIVKIDNNIIQHLDDKYNAEITDESLIVTEITSNNIVLEFKRIGNRKFKINGVFNAFGKIIVATDASLKIGSMTLSNNTFDNCSSAIGLR